jgi:hypothetical protein
MPLRVNAVEAVAEQVALGEAFVDRLLDRVCAA